MDREMPARWSFGRLAADRWVRRSFSMSSKLLCSMMRLHLARWMLIGLGRLGLEMAGNAWIRNKKVVSASIGVQDKLVYGGRQYPKCGNSDESMGIIRHDLGRVGRTAFAGADNP